MPKLILSTRTFIEPTLKKQQQKKKTCHYTVVQQTTLFVIRQSLPDRNFASKYCCCFFHQIRDKVSQSSYQNGNSQGCNNDI